MINQESEEPETTVSLAFLRFTGQQPLLGKLVYACKRVDDPKLDFAAVNMRSDMMTLYIGHEFEKLTLDSAVDLVFHEMLHLLLQHPVRAGYMGTGTEADHHIANLAMDIVVNAMVFRDREEGLYYRDPKLPVSLGIDLVRMNRQLGLHMQPDQSVEYYFNILKKIPHTFRKDPGSSGDSGKNGCSQRPGDQSVETQLVFEHNGKQTAIDCPDHSKWNSDMSESDAHCKMQHLVRKFNTENSVPGDSPEGLLLAIGDLMEVHKVPYLTLIRRFLEKGTKGSLQEMSTFRRPPRHSTPGMIRAGRSAMRGGVLGVGLDTSGSMHRLMLHCLSELRGFSGIDEMFFSAGDCAATKPMRFTRRDVSGGRLSAGLGRAIVGGGGTDLDCLIASLGGIGVDLVLIFTDMEAPKPQSMHSKTLPIMFVIPKNNTPAHWAEDRPNWSVVHADWETIDGREWGIAI